MWGTLQIISTCFAALVPHKTLWMREVDKCAHSGDVETEAQREPGKVTPPIGNRAGLRIIWSCGPSTAPGDLHSSPKFIAILGLLLGASHRDRVPNCAHSTGAHGKRLWK